MTRSRVESIATTVLEVAAFVLLIGGLVLAFGVAAGAAFAGAGLCLGASYILTRR